MPPRSSPRGLWRLLAASPLPLLVPVWALWRDVYLLVAAGVARVGGPKQVVEWAMLCLVSAGLVATFWAGERSLRGTGPAREFNGVRPASSSSPGGSSGVLAAAQAGIRKTISSPTTRP